MPEAEVIVDYVDLHRWVVHLPLALLVLAPLFAVASVLNRSVVRRTLALSAIVLLMSGVALVFVTFGAGQQAASQMFETEGRAVLERHAASALGAKESFTAAALLVALSLLLKRLLHLRIAQLTAVLPAGAILFYAVGLVWLVEAAYYGERLAHR